MEIKNTKKFNLFMDWLDVNRPELSWATGDTVARVMKNNPSASFKSLAKMLARVAEEAKAITEETHCEFGVEDVIEAIEVKAINIGEGLEAAPSEPEVAEAIVIEAEPEVIEVINIEGEVNMQNNNTHSAGMSAEEEAAVQAFMEAFEKQIKETHIPKGKVDTAITQLAHKQASFAQRHPKTTVALTVGGACLASYGAYRLAKDFLL